MKQACLDWAWYSRTSFLEASTSACVESFMWKTILDLTHDLAVGLKQLQGWNGGLRSIAVKNGKSSLEAEWGIVGKGSPTGSSTCFFSTAASETYKLHPVQNPAFAPWSLEMRMSKHSEESRARDADMVASKRLCPVSQRLQTYS
ncbi:MAG: hypothetical protein Q9157_005374 [Trypethelium eluteriae]